MPLLSDRCGESFFAPLGVLLDILPGSFDVPPVRCEEAETFAFVSQVMILKFVPVSLQPLKELLVLLLLLFFQLVRSVEQQPLLLPIRKHKHNVLSLRLVVPALFVEELVWRLVRSVH